MVAASKQSSSFDPAATQSNNLPPWEMAKVLAFHTSIEKMVEVTGMSAQKLLGEPKNAFIAKNVVNASGGHPTERAIRSVSPDAWTRTGILGSLARKALGASLSTRSLCRIRWQRLLWI